LVARSNQHFLVRLQMERVASLRTGDPRGAIAVECHPLDERIDHDRKIASMHCQAEIGVSRAATTAVATSRLSRANSFLLRAVVVGRARVASSHTRLGKSITNGVGVPVLLAIQRPADTSVLVSFALPVSSRLK
jgi:hypothetical protein